MALQADLMIHAANVLYLFAYTVRDILWLRIQTVVAALFLLPYFYLQPEPLMTPIYWNLVFTALNLFWIARLLLERRPVKLSPDEQRLCELVFRTMTPREMIKILKLATWEEAAAGACFVARGTPLDRLMVIASGKACVEVDGRNVAGLQPGQFIGSISYITEEAAPANIHAIQALTRCQLAHARADGRTTAHLREIALRGDSSRWREWARRALQARGSE